MRDLIAELKLRAQDKSLKADSSFVKKVFPPLNEGLLIQAETDLGLRLPTTLRRIYAEVANGGFGPSYGLLGLVGGALNEDGRDVVSLYRGYSIPDPNDEHWRWPNGLLPVGHLGCAMFCCVHATNPEGPVIWFEPNPHEDGKPWDDSFIPLASSTDEWLLAWLDGDDLLNRLFSGTSE